ncbi:hypothetical protein N7333_02340 [Pseudomonas sp. GD04158]|uniref:hypothetical protein n=1 Tax=Pseudomonas sp. GD04158 TaxID=2975439 RepID=UPI00244B87FF|nr:hypothetical protein [Pseudomonas sp. GD04158]MDH0095417.1 hypothetical protein [Pseudomonas sp. GD04158]
MSILNVFIAPDRALIGVDTEAMLPDGTTHQVCKLVTVPHLGLGAGFRGVDMLFATVCPAIIAFKGAFDELAQAMPGNIAVAEAFCREQFGFTNEDLAFNLVIAGYSESERKMVGHAYFRWPDGTSVKHEYGFPQFMGPEVTQDQLARLDIEPDQAAGGRFFIAEARRNSIRIEQAFKFPSRPEKVG